MIGLTLLVLALSGLPAWPQEQAAAPTADKAAPNGPLEIAGPRELLRMRGIDESQLERLNGGLPWDGADNETLLRVMYHVVRDFRQTDIEGWSRGEVDLKELAADAPGLRGEIFHLTGRVTRIEVRSPAPETAQRFEIEQYYVCELRLADGDQPAVVLTPKVPKAWPVGEPIDERTGAFGLFLKLTGENPKRPVPVFVAARVAWYPDNRLGNLGMDVGLFDDVPVKDPLAAKAKGGAGGPWIRLKDLRLTGHDRECFYQLLHAVGQAKPGQLRREALHELRQQETQEGGGRTGADSFSVEPLFNAPHTQQGRLVVLSGTARRVVPVRVSDEDVVVRFGITHYYQLYVFTDDSQDNPVVFCVRELPEGMPTGDGPEFAEPVTVAGFFLKTWAYQIDRPESDADREWQLAPLLIGREADWNPSEPSAVSPIITAVAGTLFLATLLGVWFVVWRFHRSDRRFRESVLARHLVPASEVSLDDLHPEPGDGDGDSEADSDRADDRSAPDG